MKSVKSLTLGLGLGTRAKAEVNGVKGHADNTTKANGETSIKSIWVVFAAVRFVFRAAKIALVKLLNVRIDGHLALLRLRVPNRVFIPEVVVAHLETGAIGISEGTVAVAYIDASVTGPIIGEASGK